MACLYSPLKLMILLHYHTSPEPYGKYEPAHAESDAVKEYVDELIAEDMLFRQSDERIRATGKAAFFIEYLMEIPFPELTWVMPEARQ